MWWHLVAHKSDGTGLFVHFQNPKIISTKKLFQSTDKQTYLYCSVSVTYGNMYWLYCFDGVKSTTGLIQYQRITTKPSRSAQKVHLEPPEMLKMRKNEISMYYIYRRHEAPEWGETKEKHPVMKSVRDLKMSHANWKANKMKTHFFLTWCVTQPLYILSQTYHWPILYTKHKLQTNLQKQPHLENAHYLLPHTAILKDGATNI